MSGDWQDWNNKPVKDFRAKQNYQEAKRESRISAVALWLFVAAMVTLAVFYMTGVLK